jgi:CHAT domain-containing protein
MLPLLSSLFLVASLASPSPAATVDPGFAKCHQLAAREPESEETAKCYEETGSELGREEEARAHLQKILKQHPGSPWPTFRLAFLMTDSSEALLRQAAKGFAARRDAKGEVLARTNLYRRLFNSGRVEEAEQQVERAVQAAEASGQSETIARARTLKARHLWGLGKDLEQAYVLLRRAEVALFSPGVTYYPQRDCLTALGNLSLELGRYREGYDALRRLRDLAIKNDDGYAEANARYGMARAVLDESAELPTEERRQEVIRLAQEALDSAIAAENLGIQAKAHWMLGALQSGDVALHHLEACLAAADTVRDRSYCLNALARHFASTDPRRAQAAIDESLELARKAEDYWTMAFAWRERMRTSWAAGSYDRAVKDSQSALNAIEALRELQAGSTSQARVFSTWSEDYYWFSGSLLQAALANKGNKALEQAFLVAERMRARTLADTLEAARAIPAEALPLRRRRAAAMEEISSVQRRLLDPDLPPAERAEANRHLGELELEERDLQNQLAKATPAHTNVRQADFASLARVRQALAPNEALLAFQVAPWEDPWKDFSGGSWLTVVTKGGTRVYRLPGRGELRSAVRLFVGTFNRRDGSETLPAVALYRKLLEPALKDLPAGIEELTLIPDDVLNQLPFAALRASREAPPLAARFMLSQAPSATLLLEWKKDKTSPARTPALVFADPPPPGGENRETRRSTERSAAFASTFRLGSLPYARRESRSVVSHMGGGSVRRLGEKAAEAFLKHAPLHEYALLHFATHAVTDEANPERSGVLLAPGDAAEDGLLQIREIVDLYLKGRTVVLSACSTNTGAVLRGEGVMSLARAFFQAGANTVVASLWKLRDDEAAEFFDRFYDHLGRGLSVAASAHAAQREMIEEGAPAAAWAGIVVLGDGDAVPLPGGRRGPALPVLPVWAWSLAGGVLLLAASAGLFWFRRRPAVSPV